MLSGLILVFEKVTSEIDDGAVENENDNEAVDDE
jgi:hypothetical protein